MTGEHEVWIARIYDRDAKSRGVRLLIDRLWPRGIAKKEIDEWIKDVAPSNELRKWFGHDPEKWDEFRRRYRAELCENRDAVERCLEWLRKGDVTLLYGAKDKEHNQAIVLRDFLLEQARKK
tara:strand:+ start:961 stop:1326 length:366 start_codon:yes stop_codon:yes gene_type:complete